MGRSLFVGPRRSKRATEDFEEDPWPVYRRPQSESSRKLPFLVKVICGLFIAAAATCIAIIGWLVVGALTV